MIQNKQIQHLLDEGNIGDSINARGGFSVSGNQVIFLKTGKNKIVVSGS